mgnify:CR=1 FL=1
MIQRSSLSPFLRNALSQIEYLLLGQSDSIIYIQAIQVNYLFSIIFLIYFIKNLPCDIIIDLLENILELIVGNHVGVIWDFYTLVVFFVCLRLLEVFDLVILFYDVVVVSFALVSRVSRIIYVFIWKLFRNCKGLVIGTNVWKSSNYWLSPKDHWLLPFRHHIHFNLGHLLIVRATVWKVLIRNRVSLVADILYFVKVSSQNQWCDLGRFHFY